MNAGVAWYVNDRAAFLRDPADSVVGRLASGAAAEGLHIEREQHEEWRASVGVLQRELEDHARKIALLKTTLAAADLAAFRHVLLEFDFRRRGLRMDCVLLGDGVIAVVEFKRSKLGAADREQVTNYALNLVEFHEETPLNFMMKHGAWCVRKIALSLLCWHSQSIVASNNDNFKVAFTATLGRASWLGLSSAAVPHFMRHSALFSPSAELSLPSIALNGYPLDLHLHRPSLMLRSLFMGNMM